eukprot:TRINITY_DN24882_c0_g1_i1.p1 TRINITY_DN24882_c0_g1~~TRINITY_DN24882_c0_g1_i1.p1  ORF type:complete len:216 (+),score=61.56 TRINITY_DN24882_c0_g1_i1:35-682(+)
MGGGKKGGKKGGKGFKGPADSSELKRIQKEIDAGLGKPSVWPVRTNFKTHKPEDVRDVDKSLAHLWAEGERTSKKGAYYDHSDPPGEARWNDAHMKADIGMLHLERIYDGKCADGNPPEPGSAPSSWPKPEGQGFWNRNFPPELFVTNINNHIRSQGKRKTTTSRNRSRIVRKKVENEEDDSEGNATDIDDADDYNEGHDDDATEPEDEKSDGSL